MRFTANYLSPKAATALFNWSLGLAWQHESFAMYGRTVQVPRRTYWFGDEGLNYRYTGLNHAGAGWPDELTKLRERIQRDAGVRFNFVLLNRYDDGGQYMGWHRDDERNIDPEIASLSLGASRRFRHRQGPGERSESLQLTHGSLLLFDGRLQHTLCKTKKPTQTRINMTFRRIAA